MDLETCVTVNKLIEEIDEAEDDAKDSLEPVLWSGWDEAIVKEIKQGCVTKFRAAMVNSAKAKFGPRKMSEANRLVIRNWLYEEMKEHGLRPSHIARHIDLVTNLVFVPSKHEILAQDALAVATALNRCEDRDDGTYSNLIEGETSRRESFLRSLLGPFRLVRRGLRFSAS